MTHFLTQQAGQGRWGATLRLSNAEEPGGGAWESRLNITPPSVVLPLSIKELSPLHQAQVIGTVSGTLHSHRHVQSGGIREQVLLGSGWEYVLVKPVP